MGKSKQINSVLNSLSMWYRYLGIDKCKIDLGCRKVFDSETWIWKKLKDVIGYNINKWMNSIRDNVQNREERRGWDPGINTT